jgi:hypothetical protein
MSDLPICEDTGEPVDECDHVAVYAYDEDDVADERLDLEREERD